MNEVKVRALYPIISKVPNLKVQIQVQNPFALYITPDHSHILQLFQMCDFIFVLFIHNILMWITN